jgi:hypothetical protein
VHALETSNSKFTTKAGKKSAVTDKFITIALSLRKQFKYNKRLHKHNKNKLIIKIDKRKNS